MEYNEFIERLQTGNVYTHGGGMHADDVCTAAIINLVCDKEGIERPEIHRIFSKEDAQQYEQDGNIVFDIGNGEFDHHQKDNAVRDNGIPYASFGKVYDVVGKELFGQVAESFEESFVQTIDKCDNTEENCQFSEMISSLNPNWDEAVSTDEAFQNAVRITEQSINERVEEIGMGGFDGRDLTDMISALEQQIYETRGEEREAAISRASELIQSAISTAKVYATPEASCGIIEFDRPGIPYSAIKEEVEEYNEMEEDFQIIGYTFPARDQLTFKPLTEEFQPSERWKGANEFDIDGMTFCHKDGISLSCINDESMFNAVEVIIAETLEIDRSDIVRTWLPNGGGTTVEEEIDEQEEEADIDEEEESL